MLQEFGEFAFLNSLFVDRDKFIESNLDVLVYFGQEMKIERSTIQQRFDLQQSRRRAGLSQPLGAGLVRLFPQLLQVSPKQFVLGRHSSQNSPVRQLSTDFCFVDTAQYNPEFQSSRGSADGTITVRQLDWFGGKKTANLAMQANPKQK